MLFLKMFSILYEWLKYFLDSLNTDADADANADACLEGRVALAETQ